MVHRKFNLTKETMKKTLYTIFALSFFLFATTSCNEDTGTTTEVVNDNADVEVNPNHIRGYGDREPGGLPPAAPEADQMYGFSTEELRDQFTTDIGVDAAVATEMVEVYYDRSRQLSEMQRILREKGVQENQADPQRINTDADRRIKEILSPEQYRTFEQNRSKYDEFTQYSTAADVDDM